MQDLTVRSENIQRIYGFYTSKKFLVNRRYQRKLIWTIEEKSAFINSIMNGYPVPLILLAEVNYDNSSVYEIIDGMQRLNAIVSFIEGEFSVDGEYFDLESMAETKLMLDNGDLIQSKPKMSREKCTNIASYVLPLSIYKMENESQIDEIFRRINSNGKHLSKQEIRQAGATSFFAEIVREISSEIRGDTSLKETLLLNNMSKISITNKELKYGINVDTVFWIDNTIIRREQVRESKDEEIIADILAYTLMRDKPGSSSKLLDEFYEFKSEKNKKAKELEDRIKFKGKEQAKEDFYKVFDVVKSILVKSGKKFNQLIFKDSTLDKIPRYFQIVYLALYELIINKNKKVESLDKLIKSLDGISKHINLSQGGGAWSAIERENNVNSVVGIIEKNFTDNTEDPAMVKWSSELENILSQSTTEQNSFDFKLGFCNLTSGEFIDGTLNKTIKTLTAMVNRGKDSVGYLIIGVADKIEDAIAVEEKTNEKSIKVGNFYITGINHDINLLNTDDDRYFQKIIQKIKMQPIEEDYKTEILNNIRFIDYGGRKVIVMKIKELGHPSLYDNAYYDREGANLDKIEMSNMGNLFKKFGN
ncbi:hypothetical protein DUF262 [[Clostridium] sordellii]|uniref:GmrSD restriction endonuclease domain-containing protein n=1 Tax=Paraclostridium sordellii TaxID=1505 RepID=UPI0005444262|nr:DUF262 domain-containing protein [Paeniclostridium sordellii]CEK29995.1 hypothetical protein DUF262 [[Clostridium] sordellii] [Paeniclostridium sordellii]